MMRDRMGKQRGLGSDGQMRIVAMGGGAGPALLAAALADSLTDLTAVVCTSDRGSSTGICRRVFGIPAPGDVRATLSAFAALSGRGDWCEVWERRLACPEVEAFHGMALGNLLICGLIQRTGSLSEAVRQAGRLLGIKGCVLPVTSDSADLEAELENGVVVQGEMEVRRPGKPPIKRLGWVGSQPNPSQGVLEALSRADLIVLGPGCLYTSVLACLLVRGVREAVRDARALRVYVCNTTTTPGQSDHLSVLRHVEVVWEALNQGGVDAVIINVAEPQRGVLEAHEAQGVSLVLPTEEDLRAIEAMGIRTMPAPLLEEGSSGPRVLHKVDTIRHDPKKLRVALEELLTV
jgi:uncharacterized cofD-like protein